MNLSKKAIEEFEEIWRKEIGTEIPDEEVQALAQDLLSLFKLICRPLPQREGRKEKDRGSSGPSQSF